MTHKVGDTEAEIDLLEETDLLDEIDLHPETNHLKDPDLLLEIDLPPEIDLLEDPIDLHEGTTGWISTYKKKRLIFKEREAHRETIEGLQNQLLKYVMY